VVPSLGFLELVVLEELLKKNLSEKKGHMHPNIHSSNVHKSQTMEGAELSFNR